MKGTKISSRHVALLRGINVGGKNMLPMKDLVGMFVAAGCEDVTTYIQSGNVVFSTDAKVVEGLGSLISTQVQERFGLRVPVVLRKAAELKKVIRSNPFLQVGTADELILHVAFLADKPGAGVVAGRGAGRETSDEGGVKGRGS